MSRTLAVVILLSIFLTGCYQNNRSTGTTATSNNQVEISTFSAIGMYSDKEDEKKTKEPIITPKIISNTTNASLQAEKNDRFKVCGIKPENASNGGYVASDDEFVYFWTGTSYENERGKFCKVANDAAKVQVLSEDMPCSINIINDEILYISQKYQGDACGPIFKMKKNGESRTLLFNKDCKDLIVTDKYLYFINKSEGNKIYRTDLGGKNPKIIINSKSNNLQYDNGFIYFEEVDKNQLFRIDTLTNKQEKLFDKFYTYIVHDDKVYFLRDWFLNTYTIKSKKTSLLYKDRIYGITLGENMIYMLGFFGKKEDRGAFAYDIASASIDGKVISIINSFKQNENKTAPLYFFNGYIFYGVDRNEGANFELARFSIAKKQEEYLGDFLTNKIG